MSDHETKMSGAAAPPAPTPDIEAETINLQVKSQRGEEIFFKVRRGTKFQKLMDAYCERKGCRINEVRFLFDGHRLNGGQTPHEHEMEDGDIIDVVVEQTGGTGTGEGKRKRETKFHYDGQMVDKEDYEDREAVRERAEEAMRNDIVSALIVKRDLNFLSVSNGEELPDDRDRDFERAVQAKQSAKEEIDFVLALAEGIRKRRLDFVAGKDNRECNYGG